MFRAFIFSKGVIELLKLMSLYIIENYLIHPNVNSHIPISTYALSGIVLLKLNQQKLRNVILQRS